MVTVAVPVLVAEASGVIIPSPYGVHDAIINTMNRMINENDADFRE
jgi:hypothetical protein